MSTETAGVERHEFQAEIQQLLDIVVHSLYTDREIFVRELVSNAADSLERLRHYSLTEKEIADADLEQAISLELDEEAKTFTIVDTGIGMTKEELESNLGTIARSGSKEFLAEMAEAARKDVNLIGQFGLGFYSAFMVAEKVTVETRSAKKDAEGLVWECEGGGSYTIASREGVKRGARITLHLKEDALEFAKADSVKPIVQEYSNFVPVPIKIGDERINTVQALWLKNKNEISDEEYNEFYKYVAGAFDDPMMRLHLSIDAPLDINALLFVPGVNQEQWGIGRNKSGVSLYCNKVLIERHSERILPEWLRFVRGVFDSADLPLSVSREKMQDSALMRKLNKVATGRILKFLAKQAKDDAEGYRKFFREFGVFLKEGVVSGFDHHKDLAGLLLFHTSKTAPGETISLEQYVERMAEGQDKIYYINGPTREAIENGPYVEAFKARDIEVIYTFEPIDDFVFSHLQKFDDKDFVSADEGGIELPGEAKTEEGEDAPKKMEQGEGDALAGWMLTLLIDQVASVRVSERLVGSPAVVLNDQPGMTSAMQRVLKAMEQKGDGEEIKAPPMTSKLRMEINPSHPLIQRLASLRKTNVGLAEQITKQLLDNCLIAAGLLADPRTILGRINDILLQAAGGEADDAAETAESDTAKSGDDIIEPEIIEDDKA